jgi:putative acetyltransferase
MGDAADVLRRATRSDHGAIGQVVGEAFGGPVEAKLVRMIRESPHHVPGLEVVAERDGEVVGHTMLSYVELDDGSVRHRVLSLSPLAVAPRAQRHGVGSALVREVLALADGRDEPLVLVEGSPVYYGRLGFEDARTFGIRFDLPGWAPAHAGQVYRLGAYHRSLRGVVVYPPAFAAAAELLPGGRDGD